MKTISHKQIDNAPVVDRASKISWSISEIEARIKKFRNLSYLNLGHLLRLHLPNHPPKKLKAPSKVIVASHFPPVLLKAVIAVCLI